MGSGSLECYEHFWMARRGCQIAPEFGHVVYMSIGSPVERVGHRRGGGVAI